MFTEEKEIDYVKLALAVCGGILLAGSIAFFVSILILDAALETGVEAIEEQVTVSTARIEQISQQAQQDAARRQAAQKRATEQQRAKSRTGQSLERKCQDFSRFYQENPGQYAQQERDKACRAYKTFVDTGRRAPIK